MFREYTNNLVIVRYGEIGIKGPSARRFMERLLVSALREALDKYGVKGRIDISEARVYIWEPDDIEKALHAASRVFGVKSLSPALHFTFENLEDLIEKAKSIFAEKIKNKRFKVEARRVGTHPFTSLDVEKALGAKLLEMGASKVDLENPEYVAYVEIRGNKAFLYDRVVEGPGGLPLGSEGRVLVLFSGGFDSTVASWRLMKRGCRVDLLHFYLGYDEPLKVAVEAAKYLADNWSFGHEIRLYIVNFRSQLMAIEGLVSAPYRSLVLRKLMLEYAESLAKKLGIEALALGDSIGQVSSQTIRNIFLTDSGTSLPILRPLSGSDKDEIVKEAIRIGVYDIVKRQIEVCAVAARGTPQGDPKLFKNEYEKVKGLRVPEPKSIDLKKTSLNEIYRALGLGP
ncbi:MAG: tRNA uracil 4-sulfurtransferase ThiI [Acidilobaceae archaeon]